MAEESTTVHELARAIGAAALGACGVVLLVAGKTTAGVAFVGAALVLALPLRRLVASARRRAWVRGGVVAALVAVAVVAVAGTDIRPEQRRTGFAPVDKVGAIVDDFVDVVSGRRGEPARPPATAPASPEGRAT